MTCIWIIYEVRNVEILQRLTTQTGHLDYAWIVSGLGRKNPSWVAGPAWREERIFAMILKVLEGTTLRSLQDFSGRSHLTVASIILQQGGVWLCRLNLCSLTSCTGLVLYMHPWIINSRNRKRLKPKCICLFIVALGYCLWVQFSYGCSQGSAMPWPLKAWMGCKDRKAKRSFIHMAGCCHAVLPHSVHTTKWPPQCAFKGSHPRERGGELSKQKPELLSHDLCPVLFIQNE